MSFMSFMSFMDTAFMNSYFSNQPSVLLATCVVTKRCACVLAMSILRVDTLAVCSFMRRLWLVQRWLEF